MIYGRWYFECSKCGYKSIGHYEEEEAMWEAGAHKCREPEEEQPSPQALPYKRYNKPRKRRT